MKKLEIFQTILDIIRQIMTIFKPEEKQIETEGQSDIKPIEKEIDIGIDIETLREMLIYDEGKVNKIYRDSLGYYTVGIGHLLTKENSKQKATQILDELVGRETNGSLTNDEVFKIFEEDLKDVLRGVENNSLLKSVYDILDPIRRLALLNMVFQMGVAGVAGFKNSMRIAKEKDWDRLETNLKQSLWYRQTTNRATRVIKVFTTGTTEAYDRFIQKK